MVLLGIMSHSFQDIVKAFFYCEYQRTIGSYSEDIWVRHASFMFSIVRLIEALHRTSHPWTAQG